MICLTTEELSVGIKYDSGYILERLSDEVVKRGIQHIQPFGRQKLPFIWGGIKEIRVSTFKEEDSMEMITLRRCK